MAAELREGDIPPDFTLPTDDGGQISLAGLRGGKAVIYFYPKDDTSGCTREAADFSTLKGGFDAAGVAVVGISPDTAKKHEKFKAKHGLSVTLAADTDKTVAGAYGVWVEKSMYGRKYMGVERTTLLLAPDGRIARIWRKVKVPGHAEEVLEAAKAL